MSFRRESLPRGLSLTVASALVALASVIAMAPSASARIVVLPATAQGGETETFAVRVANERDDVATTRAELVFPADVVVPTAEVAPVDGWTASVDMRPLDTPVTVGDQTFEEAVASIVWEGGSVAPREFEQFLVTAGPLPPEGRLVLEASQTYDDGSVERWTDPSATPGAPGAPVVDLVAQAAPAPTETTAPAAAAAPAPTSTTTEAAAHMTEHSGGSSSVWPVVLSAGALIAVALGAAVVLQRVRVARAAVNGEPDAPDEFVLEDPEMTSR
jgi:uncharacterized protein YcnI